jgi:hypothetical protein
MDGGVQRLTGPQVLAEFIHVVTDSRRFSKPRTTDQAIARAALSWEGKEVVRAIPGDEGIDLNLRIEVRVARRTSPA